MSDVHLLLPTSTQGRFVGLYVAPEHAGIKTLTEALEAKYRPESYRCSGFWFKCDDCKQACQEVLRKQRKGENCFANQKVTVCYRCHKVRKEMERSQRG